MFLQYSQVDIGQSDLLTTLFSKRKRSDAALESRLLTHFKNLIINEGRQERFLSLFMSFAENSTVVETTELHLAIINTLMPYQVPT